MFDREKPIEITWNSEEERRYMKACEWHNGAGVPKSWYDFKGHLPPPKNNDYRNCDYFVFNGVCYGPDTVVKLKQNQFFAPFRQKFFRSGTQHGEPETESLVY